MDRPVALKALLLSLHLFDKSRRWEGSGALALRIYASLYIDTWINRSGGVDLTPFSFSDVSMPVTAAVDVTIF